MTFSPNRLTNTPTLDVWFTPVRFGLLLGVLLVVAFPGVWFGTQTFFRSDYGVLAYPTIFYQRESFWRGELPLWNPLSNCGVPFLAQWGTMVLYPGALIYLLLPLPWSLGLFCLLHLWLGGLGMFQLAKRWTGNSFAASVAGTTFVFSGLTLACLIWPNYTVALGWLPWIVLLAERAGREGGRMLVLAALAGAMQMMSGAPELILLTWLAAIIFAFFGVANSADKLPNVGIILRRILAIIILVAGLCAVQLLPFFDLLTHSQRDASFATTKWSLPTWGWANLLVPLFRCAMSPQGFYFQQGQEFFTSTYLGMGVVTLALVAIWRVGERRVWLLAALTAFVFAMALGENSFVYRAVKLLIPSVGFARYPVKFILLVTFTMPLLAAFGVRWCLQQKAEGKLSQWRPLFVVSGALTILAVGILWFAQALPLSIYDRIAESRDNEFMRFVFFALIIGTAFLISRTKHYQSQKTGVFGILLFLSLDAITHSPNQNSTIARNAFAPNVFRTATKWKTEPRFGETRVMISVPAEAILFHSEVIDWTEDLNYRRFAFWSHLNLLDGVPKVNGSSTLQLREQASVERLLYWTNAPEFPRIMDFLGVANATASGQVVQWTNRASALPLVTAGQSAIFSEESETLRRLTENDFNSRAVVFLPPEVQSLLATNQHGSAKISGASFSAQHLTFEVTAESTALVVIAQSFYHPWEASVDGQTVPLWRANVAFQALEVPLGKHHVEIVYRDRNFTAGLAISLAALLACGLIWKRTGEEKIPV